MRAAALVFVLLGLTVPTAAGAQGRRGDSQGIPPGHLPPPGECRVWYYGRPPGQQPPSTDCRTAEWVARRDPDTQVIYGDRGRGSWEERDRGRRERDAPRGRGRAVPRSSPDLDYPPYPGQYPDRSPYPSGRYPAGTYGYEHPAWDAGYRDGLQKGREDAQRNRAYERSRHSWYRSGTRGYERRYGSRDDYISMYREAFTAGYAEGFR